MEIKEQRIRAITSIYYTKPEVQKALLEFAKDREVVPRYFEGFGKRPDTIQYPSDINGLVKKGATSFHASEELWNDPLSLSSEIQQHEMNELRKGWDLLIDIDSKYFDVSKILTILILDALEKHGIGNYGIKFSGSKGIHIIVSSKAFPAEYDGKKSNESFPEWPRAICEYLMSYVRRDFNRKISFLFKDSKLAEKDSAKKEIKEALCPNCGKPAKKGNLVNLSCPLCGTKIQRKNMKVTKKRLKCIQDNCAGVLEIQDEGEYFECENCGISDINKQETSGRYATTFTQIAKENYSEDLIEEYSGAYFGSSDLVLVAPRHLFRMPYSLHEKTALSSVVLKKEEIENFKLSDADPFKIKIRDFMPENKAGEARELLRKALEWKQESKKEETKELNKKYSEMSRTFEEMKDVPESAFPQPIKKLLQGLVDGKKRGLFVLLTFLRSLNYSPEYINKKVRDWNEKNQPPLKEGYIRSQVDWILKQKKKILPPNYSNDSFYRDLGILDKLPEAKNPLVEVGRNLRKMKGN